MVHCKTQTAPSGQRRCLQKGGYRFVWTGQIQSGKGDQSGTEELFWQAKEHIFFQWFCFSVERFKRHYKLQDTIPQHSGESTTGRQLLWILLLIWKNTPHPPWTPLRTTINTSSNPLSPTPALKIREDNMSQVFREKRRKAPGPDSVSPACLKTCADQLSPIFTNIFNRSLELLLMLQMLHHHPRPKETQNYWT